MKERRKKARRKREKDNKTERKKKREEMQKEMKKKSKSQRCLTTYFYFLYSRIFSRCMGCIVSGGYLCSEAVNPALLR